MKIPTAADIKKYLNQYNPVGLENARVIRNLTAETANNHWNWLVEKDSRRYVIRIAKPKGNVPPDIAKEYEALFCLKETGIAPRPYWIDITSFSSPLLIEDFIYGRHPKQKPDAREVKAIARTIARLHQIRPPQHFPLADRSYSVRLKILENRLKEAARKPLVRNIIQKSGILKLMPAIRRFFKFASHFADKKPKVFLHGDLYLGNVLINRKGRAILIDFQKPAIGEPAVDFGNIFVDVSWREYYERFRDTFIKEYSRFNNYPKLEELFDLRMVERDTTSLFSEFKEAATKLPQQKVALQKYFLHKHPKWRIELIRKELEKFGIL